MTGDRTSSEPLGTLSRIVYPEPGILMQVQNVKGVLANWDSNWLGKDGKPEIPENASIEPAPWTSSDRPVVASDALGSTWEATVCFVHPFRIRLGLECDGAGRSRHRRSSSVACATSRPQNRRRDSCSQTSRQLRRSSFASRVPGTNSLREPAFDPASVRASEKWLRDGTFVGDDRGSHFDRGSYFFDAEGHVNPE